MLRYGTNPIIEREYMKISELVKRTDTTKEAIHYYIREGLLRKPRKSKSNLANYTEKHVETLLLIKELRDHYYMPLPEIKKILKGYTKKETKTDLSQMQILNRYLAPLERMFPREVEGEQAFREMTGIGKKWLAKMEEWGVIVPKVRDGIPVYSNENIILGKLVVEFDQVGFGPKSGHDPENLKRIADFIRNQLINPSLERMLAETFGKGPITAEQLLKGSQSEQVMSLFIFYLYLRISRDAFDTYLLHGFPSPRE